MPCQPAAASAALAPVLTGPPRPVTVVAATPAAVYLATGDPDCPAICLATAAAVRVPCAVVLSGVLPGGAPATGTAGAGAITLGPLTVRVARWWRPSRPRLAARVTSAPDLDVDALLGAGPGLTPYGDDVLAGALVTLVALGSPAAATLAARVLPQAFRRTTFVSAALLTHAARGECVPELAAYLAGGDPAALLRVGHTSGAGLRQGADAVLEAAA